MMREISYSIIYQRVVDVYGERKNAKDVNDATQANAIEASVLCVAS